MSRNNPQPNHKVRCLFKFDFYLLTLQNVTCNVKELIKWGGVPEVTIPNNNYYYPDSKVGQLAHSLRRDKSLVILCTAIALSCLLSVARSFSLLCKRPDLERLLVVLRFLLSTVPHPKCITLQVLSPFCFCGSTIPFELKARLQDTGSHCRLH